MKNTQIIVIIIVLLALALLIFNPKNKKADELNTNVNDPTNTNEVNAPAESTGTSTGVSADVSVGEVKEFTVTADNFSFTPSNITVNKGDKVRIVFKNTQGFHDFVVDEFGAATKQAQAPAEEVLEFVADKTGTFEFYCSVGTHRQMGMKGTLTVTE